MPSVTRPNSSTSAELDPAVETQVFWMKYKTPIVIGVVAVLLVAAAFGAYTLYTNHRDESAAAELAGAKDIAAYQKVMNDYRNTPAAATAALMMAAEQRKAQKFAEANTTLQKFVSDHPKHELITTAQMSIAANLESAGKLDEALVQYQRIASEHPRDYNAPLALLAQVPLLKAKGQTEQARQVCETILTQYRESEATAEATRYLRGFKPAATPPPVPEAAASAAPPTSNP